MLSAFQPYLPAKPHRMQPGICRRMILYIRKYGGNIINHQMIFSILQERPHLETVGGTDADKGFLSVYAEETTSLAPIKEDGFFSGALCIRMEGKIHFIPEYTMEIEEFVSHG